MTLHTRLLLQRIGSLTQWTSSCFIHSVSCKKQRQQSESCRLTSCSCKWSWLLWYPQLSFLTLISQQQRLMNLNWEYKSTPFLLCLLQANLVSVFELTPCYGTLVFRDFGEPAPTPFHKRNQKAKPNQSLLNTGQAYPIW